MGKKNKELINNISQTISKELKKPNGGNKKLIDTLQKILDKASQLINHYEKADAIAIYSILSVIYFPYNAL